MLIFIVANPLMSCSKFGVEEVFKDQEREWYDKIKKSEKPKLGDAPMGYPSILQEYSSI